MSVVRVTKLTRHEAGFWSANVTVDGITIAVDDRSGSWQTPPDENGVTKGVLPWVGAHLQDRLTAVLLEQATTEQERKTLNFLRSAAIHALRTLQRPVRKRNGAIDTTAVELPPRAELREVLTPVADFDAARVAKQMAAAGRRAAGGDAA